MSRHQLVLSACSKYFKNIFKRNKNPNLLICLDGVNSHDLGNIFDYIYNANGEVKIYQEDINRFLEVAQRFKLDGLQGDTQDQSTDEFSKQAMDDIKTKPLDVKNHPIQQPKAVKERAVVSNNLAENPHAGAFPEINQQIEEHIEKALDGTYICRLCGKKSGTNKTHIRNHIETHLEGLSFNCQHCGKAFRSRNSMNCHKSTFHRNI